MPSAFCSTVAMPWRYRNQPDLALNPVFAIGCETDRESLHYVQPQIPPLWTRSTIVATVGALVEFKLVRAGKAGHVVPGTERLINICND